MPAFTFNARRENWNSQYTTHTIPGTTKKLMTFPGHLIKRTEMGFQHPYYCLFQMEQTCYEWVGLENRNFSVSIICKHSYCGPIQTFHLGLSTGRHCRSRESFFSFGHAANKKGIISLVCKVCKKESIKSFVMQETDVTQEISCQYWALPYSSPVQMT